MSQNIKCSDVAIAIINANTPGEKSAATRLKNKYIQQRESLGKHKHWLETSIKAVITRMKKS